MLPFKPKERTFIVPFREFNVCSLQCGRRVNGCWLILKIKLKKKKKQQKTPRSWLIALMVEQKKFLSGRAPNLPEFQHWVHDVSCGPDVGPGKDRANTGWC